MHGILLNMVSWIGKVSMAVFSWVWCNFTLGKFLLLTAFLGFFYSADPWESVEVLPNDFPLTQLGPFYVSVNKGKTTTVIFEDKAGKTYEPFVIPSWHFNSDVDIKSLVVGMKNQGAVEGEIWVYDNGKRRAVGKIDINGVNVLSFERAQQLTASTKRTIDQCRMMAFILGIAFICSWMRPGTSKNKKG